MKKSPTSMVNRNSTFIQCFEETSVELKEIAKCQFFFFTWISQKAVSCQHVIGSFAEID